MGNPDFWETPILGKPRFWENPDFGDKSGFDCIMKDKWTLFMKVYVSFIYFSKQSLFIVFEHFPSMNAQTIHTHFSLIIYNMLRNNLNVMIKKLVRRNFLYFKKEEKINQLEFLLLRTQWIVTINNVQNVANTQKTVGGSSQSIFNAL